MEFSTFDVVPKRKRINVFKVAPPCAFPILSWTCGRHRAKPILTMPAKNKTNIWQGESV